MFAVLNQLCGRVMQAIGQYRAVRVSEHPYVARIGPYTSWCLTPALNAIDTDHSVITVMMITAGASTANK